MRIVGLSKLLWNCIFVCLLSYKGQLGKWSAQAATPLLCKYFFFKLWLSSLISSDNKKLCSKLNQPAVLQPVLGSNSRHCSSQPLLAQRNECEGSFHPIFKIKRFWKWFLWLILIDILMNIFKKHRPLTPLAKKSLL